MVIYLAKCNSKFIGNIIKDVIIIITTFIIIIIIIIIIRLTLSHLKGSGKKQRKNVKKS